MALAAIDLAPVVQALRAAGAVFAYLHGSQADGTARDDSDIDVGAHFGTSPHGSSGGGSSGGGAPGAWEVDVPARVDLVVLDTAPEYLAGRIALRGQLLFDDDPPARVRWEADTRVRYLDELPFIEATAREYLEAVAQRGRP